MVLMLVHNKIKNNMGNVVMLVHNKIKNNKKYYMWTLNKKMCLLV